MSTTVQTAQSVGLKTVSGRVWKTPGRKSSFKVTKGNPAKMGWEKRKELQKKKDIAKKLELEVNQEKLDEKEVKIATFSPLLA